MIIPKHEFALVIAYVDPGSGLVMLQMLGGAVLGAWFYFRRVVARFAYRFLGREQSNLTAAPNDKTETATTQTH